jgi:hypothetical protein
MHLKIEILILNLPKNGLAAKFKAAKIMLAVGVVPLCEIIISLHTRRNSLRLVQSLDAGIM